MEKGGRYKCPSCGCQLSEAKEIYFHGQHVLADITCTCCDVEYYHTMAIGHGDPFPVSFTKDFSKSHYLSKIKFWRALPLIQSMSSSVVFQPNVEILVYKKAERIVWLNCLDTCYGHVFQKILDAQRHLDTKELGLVIVIPEGFAWMVPVGVAETWVVKSFLSDLDKRITGFDEWTKRELMRFSEVKVSKAPIQPDASKIEWVRFLKQERFDLSRFQKIPYLVTFVWREDRFWHATKMEEWLFLGSRKFKCFGFVKWFFVKRQMQLFENVGQDLKKRKEKIEFAMVGLGASGKAERWILDKRINGKNSFGKETEWFPLLAKSHVVIGVLGSSMLIPTALAASFVDIVPERRVDLLGEDIAQPYTDRKSHFLGRFLFGTPSSKQVAIQVLGILQGYEHFSRLLK